MIRKDYHMHTTYCDGTTSAEEMVKEAVARGMEEIGFSGHSHTPFDESYCMMPETTEQYRQELLALREKYADQISIRIGLEMDCFSDADTRDFDYLIGSVHYIRVPDPSAEEDAKAGDAATANLPEGCFRYEDDEGAFIYITMDETPEILEGAADAFFGGDMIALAERYFETVSDVPERTDCDFIGHFDLVTKFNEDGSLLDEEDPRYVAAWKKAVDKILLYDIPFEINTGAMAKGYRSQPYPAAPIRDYIREEGGRFILSSDSHRPGTLCYEFAEYEKETDPGIEIGR